MSIKNIIFDLDDTLYPQTEYTKQCMYNSCRIIRKYFDIQTEVLHNAIDRILSKNGIESRHNYDDLWEYLNIDGKNYMPEILEAFHNAQPQIKLFENTENILKKLSDLGYTLSIITDGPIKVQSYKIKKLKIEEYFTKIIYTENFGSTGRKPSSIAFKTLLSELNTLANECIYVGNDPKRDFIPAKEVGMHSIRILQGEYKKLRLTEDYEAEFEINNVSEIYNILRRLDG